jgi:hypothetical protein
MAPAAPKARPRNFFRPDFFRARRMLFRAIAQSLNRCYTFTRRDEGNDLRVVCLRQRGEEGFVGRSDSIEIAIAVISSNHAS